MAYGIHGWHGVLVIARIEGRTGSARWVTQSAAHAVAHGIGYAVTHTGIEAVGHVAAAKALVKRKMGGLVQETIAAIA